MKRFFNLFLILAVLLSLFCACSSPASPDSPTPFESASVLAENGSYTSKETVAEYIYTYGKLPGNFITKSRAQKLGWNSDKGNLWDVAYGKSIGGDVFFNREGLLPKAKNRKWFECDIDYKGGYRNDKRIIYSNDRLIYYTGNHYKSFERLY